MGFYVSDLTQKSLDVFNHMATSIQTLILYVPNNTKINEVKIPNRIVIIRHVSECIYEDVKRFHPEKYL